MWRLVGALGLAMCTACTPGLSDADRDQVLAWLTCEADCPEALSFAVGGFAASAPDSAGAITILVQPFDTTRGGGRDMSRAQRAQLRETYRALTLPVAQGEDEFVTRFLGNFMAGVQIRAIRSLSDLGARAELQEQYDRRGVLGLRADVVRHLESALAWVGLAAGPTATSVIVSPADPAMMLGETMSLSARAVDASGVAMPTATFDWVSLDGAVAGVNPVSGLVRAVGLGQALITATVPSSGVSGGTTVRVGPLTFPPSLVPITPLNPTGGLAGLPLPALVVVEARVGGAPAAGVPVTWSASPGSGTVIPLQASTLVSGRASAVWRLGAVPGRQRLSVTPAGGQSISFRTTAGSYSGPSVLVGSTTLDGLGLGAVTVSLSSGASTLTASDGTFTFPGLPVGAYTVAVSALPPGVFPVTTLPVSITGPDQVAVADFAGYTPGSVAGVLFDDADGDDSYDSGVESSLAAAGVTITLEDSSGGMIFTDTDAAGAFSFPGLAPGAYTLTLDVGDPDIPLNASFDGVSATVSVTVGPGGSVVVNLPFDVT